MTLSRKTKVLAPDDDGIAAAGTLLASGKLVAFPTETVYGLGADATNGVAVAAIYQAKGRPSFNPLIVHVETLDAARRYGAFNADAVRLAEAFWPGPLTIVVPRRADCSVSDLALAGLDSIALRIPSSPVARAVIAASGRPIAAPSANRSGRISPTDSRHVLADLEGRIDAVVLGEAAEIGVESTIVSCLDDAPAMLRPGGVPREAIEVVLGRALAEVGAMANPASDAPLAPGMLASHYAPQAHVRLMADAIQPGEAALLFGPDAPSGLENAAAVINLSPSGDLTQAAARLFAALRNLDASGASSIAVSPIPNIGLGEAINDRLKRAAAPREA